MRLRYIRRLIQILEESDVEEIELSRWGQTVRISKTASRNDRSPSPAGVQTYPVGEGEESEAPSARTAEEAPPKNLIQVRSPMVATFYRALAPDAPPYVEVGDRVRIGQTLCILEAMKLMNELKSEVTGTIGALAVENGQPVEYGQVLFEIEVEE